MGNVVDIRQGAGYQYVSLAGDRKLGAALAIWDISHGRSNLQNQQRIQTITEMFATALVVEMEFVVWRWFALPLDVRVLELRSKISTMKTRDRNEEEA